MIDASQFTNGCSTLSEALTRLARHFSPDDQLITFFGFFVHLKAMNDNDFIYSTSHQDGYDHLEVKKKFLEVGGTRDDIYAPTIHKTQSVVHYDLLDMQSAMQASNDARLSFVNLLVSQGLLSAWLVPVHGTWTGGYGTLNFFYHDRHAPSPLGQDDLLRLAQDFFRHARQDGLLSGYFSVTATERRTLQSVAQGMSVQDIATSDRVTSDAVQRRIDRVRQKLSAKNRDEAVYKAFVYGALPFGQ